MVSVWLLIVISSSRADGVNAATIESFLNTYKANLSPVVSTSAPTSYAGSIYETYYWPSCDYNSGNPQLEDPANLYGCETTACSCTGEEGPIDLRDYLDSTLGAVTINSSHHFEVNGKERRFFGSNYMNKTSFPDMDSPEAAWNARMLIKRFGMMGQNLVRLHHLDSTNFLSAGWDSIDPNDLADLMAHITVFEEEKVAVDLNLHTIRTFTANSASASTTDGDNDVSAAELSCDGSTSGDHVSKNLVYVSDDIRYLEKKFADDVLSATFSGTSQTFAASLALALIEITNENPFVLWYEAGYTGDNTCNTSNTGDYSEYWEGEILDDYRAWLTEKYGSFSDLQSAWMRDSSVSDLISGYSQDLQDWNPDETLATSLATSGAQFRRVFWGWEGSRANVSDGGSTVITTTLSGQGYCDAGDCTANPRYALLTLTSIPSFGVDLNDYWTSGSFKFNYIGFPHAPSGSEIDQYCSDGVDNDGDGFIDGGEDTDMDGALDSGEDDDGDGILDLADPDCNGQRSIRVERDCNDGNDDDSDARTDTADVDCQAGDCSDGADGDSDGFIDAADPQCADGNVWESASNYTTTNIEITRYNVDENADGIFSGSEALILTEGQAYTLKITYRVESYADQSGGTNCEPSLTAALADGVNQDQTNYSPNESGMSHELSTDSSSWHTLETCVSPDFSSEDGQVVLALGSNCQTVILDIDELNVYPTAAYGLQSDETSLSTVALMPYEQRYCMTNTRWQDTVDFFIERAEDYYKSVRQTVRDTGYVGPLENSNCHFTLPDDMVRDAVLPSSDYSGTDYVFTDSHAYWDSGRQVDTDTDGVTDLFCYHRKSYLDMYDSPGLLTGEENYTTGYEGSAQQYNPLIKNSYVALAGMPFLNTEHGTNYGNPYMPEGVLFTAIHSSFQDWDGITMVTNYNLGSDSQLEDMMSEQKKNGLAGNMDDPAIVALMPTAALIVRNNYAQTSAESITFSYSDEGGYDDFKGGNANNFVIDDLPAAISLIHPFRRQLEAANNSSVTDFSAEIADFNAQAAALKLESSDGLLTWDFTERVLKLDADKAQVIAGFIQGKNFATDKMGVYIENPDYAIVSAVSLDDKSFDQTEYLWVAVTAYQRNDGQETMEQVYGDETCYDFADWLGTGAPYDESTDTGYSEVVFPTGILTLNLGSTVGTVQVKAIDALGREATVTTNVAQDNVGLYGFEFNRQDYDFNSGAFGSNGSVKHTFWFKVDITRVTTSTLSGTNVTTTSGGTITNDTTTVDTTNNPVVVDAVDTNGQTNANEPGTYSLGGGGSLFSCSLNAVQQSSKSFLQFSLYFVCVILFFLRVVTTK